MYNSSQDQKQTASEWFENLRNNICDAFETIEADYANKKGLTPGKFERKSWKRDDQAAQDAGGGTMSIMKGNVFEKVGVNISTVHGVFSEEFRKRIPGASDSPEFWASGISLVAHMVSPKVPAVHMNTRHIVTSKSWFGGGADLTPIFPDPAETKSFHQSLQDACDKHDSSYYPKFKDWCDKYFFLKHRNEARGIGGIFYDNLNSGNWENDFAFTKDVGMAFTNCYPQLVRKKMYEDWTDEDRKKQLVKRGRYVEFNLLYDRGTTFGLQTGGNVEAILMSLPPEVNWP